MQAAPRRCQLLQEKSRTVVVTARSSRTTKNSSGRRLFSERTCCARSGVWSISELKVARMLEICQSLFLSRGVQKGAWLLCEVAGEVRHGQDRGVCFGLLATGSHGFQYAAHHCLRETIALPQILRSVPPLQVDSSEKACHSRCCLSEASLRASCGPI